MTTPAIYGDGFTAESYFALVEDGILSRDERVELLEGMIVAMAPQDPAHAATVWLVSTRLTNLVGTRAMVRSQLSLLAGPRSVPEPDVAVVPWRDDLWQHSHPDRCFLAVEVASSSLAQDRLTKSRIYAAAGVEHYWIINLRQRCVEWFFSPDAGLRVYGSTGVAIGDDPLPPTSLGLELRAGDLFPPRGTGEQQD